MLEACVRELKTALAGKDPRAQKIEPCSLVVSLIDHGSITIRVGARVVDVDVGDTRDPQRAERSALLHVDLATWVELASGRLALAEAPLDLFGDPRVLSAVGRLVSAKRSAISARSFR